MNQANPMQQYDSDLRTKWSGNIDGKQQGLVIEVQKD